jgi:hypothetical protein
MGNRTRNFQLTALWRVTLHSVTTITIGKLTNLKVIINIIISVIEFIAFKTNI